MSSNPTEPRSIARQLVLFFALAAALLLFCGLGVLYWIVVRHAFEEDNEVLGDKVLALRADLERSGGLGGLNEELAMLQRGQRVAYFARVMDEGGQTAAESPGMTQLLPVAAFPPAESGPPATWLVKDVRVADKLYSLVSVLHEAAGHRYTVQVAQDRSADDQFTREFAALVAGVLALGVLAAAIIAIRVTRRGLRPLTRMTDSLQHIGPHQLHERLTLAGWPRELRPLAAAFDHMLDRLEDSFTRLSQFSADLAHELRTPVANIRGETEVALTRERPAEEYREVIISTLAESERLSGIIDNLLFLARAEATDRQVARVNFGGRAALEKIASYYHTIAEEQQITLSCSGDAIVSADRLLFDRAVTNLVDNALRFSAAGGTIQLTIRATQDAAEVSVIDTGSGIAAQHLSRVFDRFYRADPSRSSEGTGLGLALVKSIASLHGGSVRIASEMGHGTTVTLTWPSAETISVA